MDNRGTFDFLKPAGFVSEPYLFSKIQTLLVSLWMAEAMFTRDQEVPREGFTFSCIGLQQLLRAAAKLHKQTMSPHLQHK